MTQRGRYVTYRPQMSCYVRHTLLHGGGCPRCCRPRLSCGVKWVTVWRIRGIRVAIHYRTFTVDDVTLTEITEGDERQLILIINGVKYELDLSQASLELFQQAMEPFLRHVEGSRLPPDLWRETVGVSTPATKKMIRDWWEQNWQELDLPEPGPHGRGRIPKEVETAYYAHNRRTNGNDRGAAEGDDGTSG